MTIKVVTDASSRYKAVLQAVEGENRFRAVHPSSIGVVVSDGDHVIGEISQKIGLYDSNHAEFLAMYHACKLLIDMGVTRVHFSVDCMNLVLMINQGVVVGSQEVQNLSDDIKAMLAQLDSFTIKWEPRRNNKAAHRQASHAFRAVD